jgi:deoxyribodipyrimidine photolyase
MRTNLFILFLNHDYTEEDEQLFNEELIFREFLRKINYQISSILQKRTYRDKTFCHAFQ